MIIKTNEVEARIQSCKEKSAELQATLKPKPAYNISDEKLAARIIAADRSIDLGWEMMKLSVLMDAHFLGCDQRLLRNQYRKLFTKMTGSSTGLSKFIDSCFTYGVEQGLVTDVLMK